MTSRRHYAALLIAYTVAVCAVDSLATREVRVPIDWTVFAWRHESGFDLFKFVFWLVVPVLITQPWRDLGWFGVRRWKQVDLIFLAGLCVLGGIAIAAVARIPALREMYPSFAGYPDEVRWQFASYALIWLSSWLIGWEFLHRFVLARALAEAFPRAPILTACVIVSTLDAAYHLAQGKGVIEAGGVLVFSALLTAYAVHRRNALLPFLAHLFVELGLIAFMVMV